MKKGLLGRASSRLDVRLDATVGGPLVRASGGCPLGTLACWGVAQISVVGPSTRRVVVVVFVVFARTLSLVWPPAPPCFQWMQ